MLCFFFFSKIPLPDHILNPKYRWIWKPVQLNFTIVQNIWIPLITFHSLSTLDSVKTQGVNPLCCITSSWNQEEEKEEESSENGSKSVHHLRWWRRSLGIVHRYFSHFVYRIGNHGSLHPLSCAIPQHLLLQVQAVALEHSRADHHSKIQHEEQLQFQSVQFSIAHSPYPGIECIVVVPAVSQNPTR